MELPSFKHVSFSGNVHKGDFPSCIHPPIYIPNRSPRPEMRGLDRYNFLACEYCDTISNIVAVNFRCPSCGAPFKVKTFNHISCITS